MSIWPWDWFNDAARDTTETIMASVASMVVGLFVAIVGLAIIAKVIPVPGGQIVTVIAGAAVTVIGLMLALGVIP